MANTNLVPISLTDDSEPIELTTGSSPDLLQSIRFPSPLWRLAYLKKHWTKFTVIKGAKLDEEELLTWVIKLTPTEAVFPALYKTENNDAIFYLYNCGPTIKLLCLNELCMNYPPNDGQVLFKLHVGSDTDESLGLNLTENITAVVKKRYNNLEMTLDFTEFHRDPDLRVFCPLRIPKLFHFVMGTLYHIVKIFLVKKLILCNNNLRVVETVQYELEELDLRNNKLKLSGLHGSITFNSKLQKVCNVKLKKLWLDGNPCCDKFTSVLEYCREMQDRFPSLEQLDGISLASGQWMSRNFVVKADAMSFVDQFLYHYFDLYDSSQRRNLCGMYHFSASLSITSLQLMGYTTTNNSRLSPYMMRNRNLLKQSDVNKSFKLLYRGPLEIADCLGSLPQTEHDPYSFTVDVPYFQANTVIISITGVFREPMAPSDTSVRGFHRTFVLVRRTIEDHNEFKICNDMLSVSNATTEQAQASFVLSREPRSLPEKKDPMKEFTSEEKDAMLKEFTQLTETNLKWARMFLLESDWTIEDALVSFKKQFSEGLIPKEAMPGLITA